VLVLGDRMIAPDSWIASGPGLPVDKITPDDVGKACWIRVKFTSKDTEYGNRDIRGTIRATTPGAIILKDAHDMWGDYKRPILAVENGDVRFVQIIGS